MPKRRANGEGTIYKRKDGRWQAAVMVTTPEGTRKRLTVYGKTKREAHEKLLVIRTRVYPRVVRGLDWDLSRYLDYWIENYVKVDLRPTTYNVYEMTARVYLKPGLGTVPLTRYRPHGADLPE